MTQATTWRRRLTQRVLSCTSAVMPKAQLDWVSVVQAEVQHIADDRVALHWALGGLRAGVAERVRTWRLQRLLSAHSVSILWIGIFIASSSFNLCLAAAARMDLERSADALGRWLQGFQYDRFHAFAQVMPIGLFMVLGIIVMLFITALYLSLKNRRSAFPAFCGAILLSLAAWLYQLEIPAYLQAMSAAHRWQIGICFAMTAGVLMALKMGDGGTINGGQP